jgi:anaerobic magnesium-protoporphyrin IX monomethyl ester cyclase
VTRYGKSILKNPKYLDLVEKRFGIQQRKNVEEMSSIPLKRKILEE